jgi:hypothetical protein
MDGSGSAAVLPEPVLPGPLLVPGPISVPAPAPVPEPPAEPVPARALIAENLRRLRTDAGVGVEQVVRAAQGHGLDWTATWLSGVERGSRGLTAEQLLAMPVVLADALGFRVTLADLIAGEAPVLLVGDVPVSRSGRSRASVPAGYLRDLVTGQPVRRPFSTAPASGPVPEVTPAQRAAEQVREIRRAGLGDVDIRALGRAQAGTGEAETRLARRLAVAPVVVAAAAASLWGRSLTEERDARVASGEGPVATVSRRLTADLAARLDEARLEEARRAVSGTGTGAADWRDAPDS